VISNRLNPDHELFEPLKDLFDLEPKLKSRLLSVVARELKSRRLPVKEARIFGSAARGAMSRSSDVDLALITSRDGVTAAEAAAEEIADTVRRRFGVRLNTLVGSRRFNGSVWAAIESEGVDLLVRHPRRSSLPRAQDLPSVLQPLLAPAIEGRTRDVEDAAGQGHTAELVCSRHSLQTHEVEGIIIVEQGVATS
jgi:predicted nucleotidyltransferase